MNNVKWISGTSTIKRLLASRVLKRVHETTEGETRRQTKLEERKGEGDSGLAVRGYLLAWLLWHDGRNIILNRRSLFLKKM